jgi:hypothetical protein
VSIDEAYVRAYFGGLEIEGGLRKLTWGKADSLGPLDVVNPLDTSAIYTEMADNISLTDVKIARPLVHASFRFGDFSKIEGVFVPWFEPHAIPREGRWADVQMRKLANPPLPAGFQGVNVKINLNDPDTSTVDYAQAGLRFTTTLGSSDIGAQYYYGRLPQPAVKLANYNINLPDVDVDVNMLYNPYHQIGLDYAQVLFGFNVRAELAGNITEDLKGDDGTVYNPSLAWSFGFDRDIFWGVNLNLQVNESIRLLHDKLGSEDFMSVITGGFFDIEGGMSLTATRLTATISRKFLRDELELRTAVVWGIEDGDCVIMPAFIWTKNYIRLAFSGGIFIGNEEGQFGQYHKNSFVKAALTYSY